MEGLPKGPWVLSRIQASREFVCSDYVRLEVIPKPTYEKLNAEVQFYEDFFASVAVWLPFSVSI